MMKIYTMATPRKNPEDKLKVGAKSSYKPEYCQALIEHGKRGGSITSFGSIVGVWRQTLYDWMDTYPEFNDARKLAEVHVQQFLETMAKTMASGQLRRIKSEKPMLDKNDKPILDPSTGKVLMHTEYEPATPGQAAFIFYAKNVGKWRDRHDVELSGKDGGPISFADKSTEDLRKELLELQELSKKFLK